VGANERANKDKGMAAYMKKMGVRRTSQQCVMGCGKGVGLSAPALMAHLGQCQGKKR
jgi:hypothetical protein